MEDLAEQLCVPHQTTPAREGEWTRNNSMELKWLVKEIGLIFWNHLEKRSSQ